MELFNIRHHNVPSDAVNIMRPGNWGNPFTEQEWGREGCIALYEHWLFLNPTFVAYMRKELRNKDLVCCCWPKQCHGDVILRVVAKGEEPQPLGEANSTLVAYLAKQKDGLAAVMNTMQGLLNNPAPDGDGGTTIGDYEALCTVLLPFLKRLTANRKEGWPKPPLETVPVLRKDIIEWREEWLETQRQIASQEEGVDIVTPFDHYLYGRN